MAKIPSAKIYLEEHEQKMATLLAAKSVAKHQEQERWVARLSKAADELVDYVTKQLVHRIKNASASSNPSYCIEARFERLGQFQGLPGDVILYGHRTDHTFYARRPLELGVQPFTRLQADFYRSGWFLVDESDPSKSFTIVFRLFPKKPVSRAILWHKHNIFDEEMIKALIKEQDEKANVALIKEQDENAKLARAFEESEWKWSVPEGSGAEDMKVHHAWVLEQRSRDGRTKPVDQEVYDELVAGREKPELSRVLHQAEQMVQAFSTALTTERALASFGPAADSSGSDEDSDI
jgi:hypothetical protein